MYRVEEGVWAQEEGFTFSKVPAGRDRSNEYQSPENPAKYPQDRVQRTPGLLWSRPELQKGESMDFK